MSISSRIQEIETHIGDVYDTIDYSYDTTGINKNIINIPKYLKKGYIGIINNGIDTLYNNFPKVSGIGSNLSLTPTYEAPMKLNEIQGDTLQDGSPTPDTPVPIQSVTGLQNINVCGKNLISSMSKIGNNIFFNGTSTTDEYVFKAGTYTFNYVDSTARSTYIKSSDGKQTYLGGGKPLRFTSNLDFNLRIYGSGITLEEVSNVQLEQGSTATSYEPYKINTYEVNLGKNLINYNGTEVSLIKSTNRTANVNFNNIPILEPGTYTLSLDDLVISNSNYGLLARLSLNNTLESTIYTFTDKKISFTLTERKTLNYIYVFLNSGDDDNATATFSKIQLEKGSQATSYSPYFTPIELNKIVNYQDSIKKSTGKNLFDVSKCITGYIDANGNIATSDPSNLLTDYIKVQSDNNYTISLNTQFSNIGYALFDSNKTYISRQNNNNKTTLTITIPSNAEYLRIWFNYNGTTTLTPTNILTYQPMINEGSTALAYEPYGKVWYVEKQIGKVVLDGSENWSENGENTDYGQYSLSISNKQYGNDLLSDKFIPHTGSTGNYIWGRSTNNNIYITIAKSIISYGLATFKTWLSTHNTEVLYVLATPEYTEITNTELIEDLETLYTAKSQEGTTNISITSEDLEMILNVSALEGDA